MQKERRKIFFATICGLIVLAGSAYLLILPSLSDKLAETHRVDANILVVEGWLPPDAIKLSFNEFNEKGYDRIFTTGLKTTADYFNVFTNGRLVFHTSKLFLADTIVKSHIIEIKAFSSLSGKNRAAFNVIINDSVIASFKAGKVKKKYSLNWQGRVSEIDSLSVEFLNDRVVDEGDRNLFVKEVIFNHKIYVPYQQNSVYRYPDAGRIVEIWNNYISFAQLARNRFLTLGIDSTLVVDIPGKKVIFNRTLVSALAFRDRLRESNFEVQGVNIVTLGTHGRRTWMIYKKILDKKYNVGVITLPDFREQHSGKYKILKTFREVLGIIYYWFVLFPY